MISKTKTRAVGYVRMSNLRQDGSPEQQRMELKRLAEEYNCEQIREYFDEGKSGSKDLHKRDGFNQMITDAETINDFEVILVRDQDRFGRMGVAEFFNCLRRLNNVGVTVISTKGKIKADSFAEIMKSGVEQYAVRRFSVNLSQEVLRGYCRSAQNNKMSIILAPYGYAKQILDENGEPLRVVSRTGSFTVPKTWSSILILGDPEEVDVVRWMFDEYSNKSIGLRSLVKELNKKGTLPPQAGRRNFTGNWNMSTIKAILKNRVYEGDYVFGRRCTGSFYFFGKDGPVKRDASNLGTRFNSDEECKIIRDAFEPIVDRQVFKAVQKRLERNQKNTSHIYLLGGLFKCGHCGMNMKGMSHQKVRRYFCDRSACGNHSISEDRLVAYLIRLLQKIAENNWSELKKEIEKKLKQSNSKVRSVDDVTKQLKTLQSNWKSAEPFMLKDVFSRLVSQVTLYFNEDTTKKTHRYSLQRAIVLLPSRIQNLLS